MLKTFTWISLGLSLLGAVADFAGPARPDAETAAEMAMLAKVLVTSPDGEHPVDSSHPGASALGR